MVAFSVTFMSDVVDIFSIVVCPYKRIRAQQSAIDHCAIAWLYLACYGRAPFALVDYPRWRRPAPSTSSRYTLLTAPFNLPRSMRSNLI